jgi:hypothetical protein
MFIFDDCDQPTTPLELDTGSGKFTVQLQAPSAEDRIADDALAIERFQATGEQHTRAFTSRFTRRLQRVVDWSGVALPNKQPLPFSLPLLVKMLSQYPCLIDQLGVAFNTLYAVKSVQPGETQGGFTTTATGSTV